MKILMVCQYYFPEPFRVHEICEELVRRGHEVMVVTGEPNYPEGVIYPGYENHCKSDEVINGVRVHRCRIIPRKTGVLFRFLNYYSYALSAKRYIRKAVASDSKPFDAVLVYQLSPVMMAEPAIKYKSKYHVPVLMYCLDLWPESLTAGGIKEGSIIIKAFYGVSRRIYRKMDRILVTSSMFSEYLKKEFDIEDGVIDYLPQFAEIIFDELPPKKPSDTVNLTFAGNIGDVQSVETILKAAQRLTDRNVYFHIVGGGTDLERLRAMASDAENVTFHGRHSLKEMPQFYADADAMLVTLRIGSVLSYTLPGKVQSYLAAGKPIIGAIDGETARIVDQAQCGYCGPAEDVDQLVENICRFLAEEDKEQMGANARDYYLKHFARDMFMDRLEKELELL